MKNPSASVVASVDNASSFNRSENEAILSKWCHLLYNLSIYRGGFTVVSGIKFFDQLSVEDLPTSETLISFHADLDPLAEQSHWLLDINFEKDNKAYIADCTFGFGSNREDEEAAKTRFADFLGFNGTWEEVILKTVELNNFVVSISAIPPIPDSLRE